VKYVRYLCGRQTRRTLGAIFPFIPSNSPIQFPERKIETMKLTTYLNFGGNCAEALHFYEEHLGGKILTISTYDQMPGAKDLPAAQAKYVMHARIEIADTLIMASDAPPDRYQPMRSVYLALSVDSNEEAERLNSTLSPGGEIFMKMDETFFAHRFAMLRDKFGTSWMIIHEKPMPRAA
jgi:PhnB protein